MDTQLPDSDEMSSSRQMGFSSFGPEVDWCRAQPAHRLVRALRPQSDAWAAVLAPPEDHPGFRDLAGHSDPRYLLEAAYQLYMAYLQRGDERLVVLVRVQVTGGARLEVGIGVDARLVVTRRDGGALVRDAIVVEFGQHGRPVGRLESRTLFVGAEVIAARRAARRLRLPGGPACVDKRPTRVGHPSAVGRARREDVLLEALPRTVKGVATAGLLVPPGRGYVFDSAPTDHVPSASLLDAFLQLHRAAGSPQPPSRVDIRFVSMCETDVPCTLTLDATDGTGTRLSADQGGVVARATVT